MEQTNLAKDLDKDKYVRGAVSPSTRNRIVNAFHNEVIRQILLGNRVMLPGGLTIEIIKHQNDTGRVQPRLGFNYKVRVVYDKLKIKKVKFATATSLENKIIKVLKHTNFDYKLVDNGYK